MPTIQVVMDEELLQAADEAARRHRINRSALIREALRRHLDRVVRLELVRSDREGYAAKPDDAEEARRWEGVTEWPEG